MQGEVADEVRRKEEPEIVVYGEEEDAAYQDRMGLEEDFGEEEQGNTTTIRFDTSQFVSRKEHEKVLEELKGSEAVLVAAKKEKEEQDAVITAKDALLGKREEVMRELMTQS